MDIANESEASLNSYFQVGGDLINPYALGHMINHCPPDVVPNVILLDLYIPQFFFSENYLKFLPNIKVQNEGRIKNSSLKLNSLDILKNPGQFIRGVGVFALKDIKDGEELYLDYFDANMFEIGQVRDWLKKPPPISPYYTKAEYESEFTFAARIIDAFLFKKFASVYEKFERKVSHDINRHQFEEDNYYKNLIN